MSQVSKDNHSLVSRLERRISSPSSSLMRFSLHNNSNNKKKKGSEPFAFVTAVSVRPAFVTHKLAYLATLAVS